LLQGLVTRRLISGDLDDSERRFYAVQDPSVGGRPGAAVSLDLSIDTGEDLRFDTDLARVEAGAALSLSGTLSSPEISGVVTLRPDGTIQVGRNSFQVVSGRLDLDGFPLSPPKIQGAMVTKVGGTVIELDFDGEPNDLSTRLRAPEDSSLTEGDLMSLLVTGRTLENAGEGGQQMASTWAMSSFANLLHEGLGDVFTYGSPSSGPLVLSEETDPTSRMTLGFPITERFSVTYSIPLDDAERQLWILDYRVAKNFWIRAIQESGNDYTLGFSHRFTAGRKRAAQASLTGGAARRDVGRIRFAGSFPLPEADLRKNLKLRSGARYDYWQAQDDAQIIQRKLVDQGYLSAVVDVDPEASGEQVDLVFSIEAGGPTELVWEGDDPGGRIREQTQAAWDGRIPESFLVSDLAARARYELRSNRYFLAEVQARVEEAPAGRRVVFNVAQGPRGRGVALVFEGNEALDDAELRDGLPSTSSPAFFSLLGDKRAELEKGIRLRYASEGYLYAGIGEPSTSYDSKTMELRVVIPVEEGPLVKVAVVRFEGADSIPETRLREALGLKEGEPVSFSVLNEGEANIRSLYRAEGFPDARLRAELEAVREDLDVTIRIAEGLPVRIGRIRIVGNLKTQKWVIERELTFKEGDPLRTPELQESQKNLYDLGIFRTADVRVDSTDPGDETRDVVVQVVERALLDMAYGLRYNFVSNETDDIDLESEPQGLEVVLRSTFPNPFGRSETLSFTGILGGDRPLARGAYLTPRFFGLRLSTEVYLERRVEEDRGKNTLGLRTEEWKFAFQQTKKFPRGKLNLQWNYSFGEFTVLSLRRGSINVEDEAEFRSRLGGSLYEDDRDSVANPTRGRFWNLTLQIAPKVLGSDNAFFRFYGQLFYFYPLGRQLVWASSYRIGLAAGSGDELFIVDDRFKAGGPNTVRGFEHNSLGPKLPLLDPDTGQPTGDVAFLGGQAVVIMNQELRFPIYKLLHGGAYFDIGEVYPKVSDIGLSDLRLTAGAGLRVVLPFGPLRFDWAEVLNPRQEDRISRFQFSFGYAF
jgi:outer membrane protein assembly complex protein YaeT